MAKMNVDGSEIQVFRIEDEDYISLEETSFNKMRKINMVPAFIKE